mmetsp:Transcript_122815/g.358451  ORF Transcript_122815/g.358451 Transcript_122815/m.358451 type:complete len:331 (+) Transcript_122815:483-1475(+)
MEPRQLCLHPGGRPLQPLGPLRCVGRPRSRGTPHVHVARARAAEPVGNGPWLPQAHEHGFAPCLCGRRRDGLQLPIRRRRRERRHAERGAPPPRGAARRLGGRLQGRPRPQRGQAKRGRAERARGRDLEPPLRQAGRLPSAAGLGCRAARPASARASGRDHLGPRRPGRGPRDRRRRRSRRPCALGGACAGAGLRSREASEVLRELEPPHAQRRRPGRWRARVLRARGPPHAPEAGGPLRGAGHRRALGPGEPRRGRGARGPALAAHGRRCGRRSAGRGGQARGAGRASRAQRGHHRCGRLPEGQRVRRSIRPLASEPCAGGPPGTPGHK